MGTPIIFSIFSGPFGLSLPNLQDILVGQFHITSENFIKFDKQMAELRAFLRPYPSIRAEYAEFERLSNLIFIYFNL